MVRAGDILRILAADWNTVLSMLRWWKAQRNMGVGAGGVPLSVNAVWVKNSTGGDLPQGSVLEFTDFLLDDDYVREGFVFEGAEPDLTNVGWGVLLDAAPDGKLAHAAVTGPCVALVNVTSTSHTHADLENASTVLKSGTSGPFIILKHNGSTGEQLCPGIIDRGGNKHWLLKADAQVNAGASGTFSIWTGTAGSESDTGNNDTFFNRTDATISSGAFCEGVEIGGQKYAVPWACP